VKLANWLSVAEASEMIGYHEETIRRKLRAGEIKGHNIGRWRVKESDLEQYITKGGDN